MIDLSPERLKTLVSAISEGFDPEALERRVLRQLGTSWKELSGARAYSERIQALVDWALREDRIGDLLRSLHEANPSSVKLRLLNEASGLLPPTDELSEAMGSALAPGDEEAWKRGLAEAALQVCVVEVPERAEGTGFLVGPDQVMTHRNVIAGHGASLSQALATLPISVSFERETEFRSTYRVLPTAVFESDGAVVLQLDRPAGRETGSDRRFAASARGRGWVLPPRRPRPNNALAIVQYPGSAGLRVSVDAGGLVSDDGTIIRYRNSTLPGSMGSPCFDASWGLVGIHVGSDILRDASGLSLAAIWDRLLGRKRNHGISIGSVMEELRGRGLVWDAAAGIHRETTDYPMRPQISLDAWAGEVEVGAPSQQRLDAVLRTFEVNASDDPRDDVWSDPSDSPSDPDRWMWAEAAAVTAQFEPDELRTEREASMEARVAVLLESSPLRHADGPARWILSDRVRIRALERLAERNALEETRARNPGDPDDPLNAILGRFINGVPPTRSELQDPDRVRAMLQVTGWLSRAGSGPVAPAELRANLERATLLSPFRHLTRGFFAGREEELADLLGYVAGPDVNEAGRQRPPLMLYAPGGMGKSALLARFVLAHAASDATDPGSWQPFVYLDFDRPELDARDRLGVLLAIAKQIGPQVPAVEEQSKDLIADWASRRRRTKPLDVSQRRTRQSQLADRASEPDVRRLTHELAQLLASAHRSAPGPLLLILDTMEEVQYATPDAVLPLAELVIDLRRLVPHLRPILSGRVEIGAPAELTLKGLSPLSQEAAEALLENHLPPSLAFKTELVTRIVQVVGGNPLSLRLAAQALCHETDVTSEELDERELWERVGDAVVQGQLYERIVGHLHDGPVKQLAIPGLVLRYVTPRLIREVLAEPCGIHVPDDDSAQALFGQLGKEVALVRQDAEPGKLMLRPELRRTVLDNFRRDAGSKSKRIQIHQAAVQYFARGPRLEDRAEEIYHRLWLDQEPEDIEVRWLPGIEISLRSAVEELQGRARVFLAGRVGGADDDAVARTASTAEWETYVEKRASDLLRLDSASAALDLLEIRKDRTATSRLHLIESVARRSLPKADLAGAERAAERAVEAARESSDPGELRSALQELVQVKRMRNDIAGALRALAELGDLGQLLGDDLILLQANVEGLETTMPDDGVDVQLSETALRVFGRLPDGLVAQAPELARRVAAQVGGHDPSTLKRVMRLAGPGPLDQEAAEDLKRILMSWCREQPELRAFVPDGPANPQQLVSAVQYLLATQDIDGAIARMLSVWLRRLVTPGVSIEDSPEPRPSEPTLYER
ncbi:serine protease [Methylobacterium oxalidis]|uniref:serine protease n=1 Tax=Methylobacterium oxalidis TaxID=944322 RepID=UPI0033162AF1